MRRPLEERMSRLERCFLMALSLMTGEAEKSAASPEELAKATAEFGQECQQMADELKEYE